MRKNDSFQIHASRYHRSASVETNSSLSSVDSARIRHVDSVYVHRRNLQQQQQLDDDDDYDDDDDDDDDYGYDSGGPRSPGPMPIDSLYVHKRNLNAADDTFPGPQQMDAKDSLVLARNRSAMKQNNNNSSGSSVEYDSRLAYDGRPAHWRNLSVIHDEDHEYDRDDDDDDGAAYGRKHHDPSVQQRRQYPAYRNDEFDFCTFVTQILLPKNDILAFVDALGSETPTLEDLKALNLELLYHIGLSPLQANRVYHAVKYGLDKYYPRWLS